jgi:hypothetical protein
MRSAVTVTLIALSCTTTVGCITMPAPAPAAPAGDGTAAAAPAAAPSRGLFGMRKTPEQRALCRVRFAQTPLGQMVNNLLKPAEAVTGGLLKPIGKDQPNPENLKKPADSAQGAAAKIKAEELQAKEKMADIEYLAKKDCKRYPEAEAALIAALRAEKNECVRYAAAKALLNGCCCTTNVMKALIVCVNASNKDGNVAEDSERVRLTAFAALEKCSRTVQPAEQPPEKPPEKGAAPADKGEVAQAGHREPTPAEVMAEARAVLAKGITLSQEAMAKLHTPNNLKHFIAPPNLGSGPMVGPPPVQPRIPADSPTEIVPVVMPEAEPTPILEPSAEPKKPRTRTLLDIAREAIGR